MKPTITCLLLLIITLLIWKPVAAQTSAQISEVQISHTYGSKISFSALVLHPDSINDIFLFFKVEGEEEPRGSLVITDSSGHLNFTYDVQQNPIRPFANITYWFILNMKNGDTFSSQDYYYQYSDNRFAWQTLKSDSVEVNWYSGEMEFGKDAFDILHQSILRISNLIIISLDEPINLYLYASQIDLQNSLALGGQASIAPDFQVLLISIDPASDQKAQMEQLLPYELSHLLLYQKTGTLYTRLPFWLLEGIATQAEIIPNPDFDFALANAVEKQSLIPLADLCSIYPPDNAPKLLASAQSNSFTGYLFNKYGQAGMEKLIQSYTSGSDCEQGAKTSLSKNLSQLEYDWLQATFNKNAFWQAVTNFLPYLFMLLLILFIPLLNRPPKNPSNYQKNDSENS